MSLKRRWTQAGLAVAMLSAFLGCEDAQYAAHTRVGVEPAAPAAAPAPAGAADQSRSPSPVGAKAADSAAASRKIIYNARIELVTEDLGALEKKLIRMVETSHGYVADSQVSGKAGDQRDGMWKVRIPVEAYDSFLADAVALGELVRLKADAQDVSEEYYDLDARLANKKVEETRLLKLLADATGKLEEVLKVEHEVSRVREEIERFQGRLRALANLSAMTTITISAREIHGYVPPQAPTFTTRVARTFGDSVDSLRRFGEGIVIIAVGFAPWVPVAALGLIPLALVARRARRHA